MRRPAAMKPETAAHIARLARAMHEASGAAVIRVGEMEFRWQDQAESPHRLSPMERRRARDGTDAG